MTNKLQIQAYVVVEVAKASYYLLYIVHGVLSFFVRIYLFIYFFQLYDPTTGDYVSQPEYMYEAYDGYDEDSTGSQVIHNQGTPTAENAMVQGDESPPALPKSKKPKVNGKCLCVNFFFYYIFFERSNEGS